MGYFVDLRDLSIGGFSVEKNTYSCCHTPLIGYHSFGLAMHACITDMHRYVPLCAFERLPSVPLFSMLSGADAQGQGYLILNPALVNLN